ncbi:MAG: DUF3857 domain-containing transglutaminase family protein [Bacteroidales bacterium]|jgi:transglutaminase-like putative cysteine protease|nr:DUF3857 domain-containing transglutaminase family protein [Bacteroidales bacterium]
MQLIPLKTLLLTALLCGSMAGHAQKTWDIKNIPGPMRDKANVVIRTEVRTVERQSSAKFTLSVHEVKSILNKDGESEATLTIFYDRNSSVSGFEGAIYDADGILLKKLKSKDLADVSNNDYLLYSDSRVKLFRPTAKLPFTVEYRYTVSYKATYGLPGWMPQPGFHIATEKSEFQVITPPELGLKYMEVNIGSIKASSETVGSSKHYKWEASMLRAIPTEQYVDLLSEIPTVYLSAEKFSYEGYEGDFSNWENLGKWAAKLAEGRAELSPQTQAKVREMTAELPDVRTKIAVLYKYLQDRTRYFNVSLGIGGWQPLPASTVDDKGYGDCKALSNYMVALLKAADIPANMVIIGAGARTRIRYPDFASGNQANHAICCVPLATDTVWLECTSQTAPFGYLGQFTANRYCLVVTDNGGHIAKTPKLHTDDNVQSTRLDVALNPDGSATFALQTSCKNSLIEPMLPRLTESKEEQKKHLLQTINANGLTINTFSFAQSGMTLPEIALNITGTVRQYGSVTGNRLFVSANFLLGTGIPPVIEKERKMKLYVPTGYQMRDSLTLNIPAGYSAEFLPESSELNSTYGSYKIEYSHPAPEKILIYRFLQINDGIFDLPDFGAIEKFQKDIRNQGKIILTKIN